MGKKEKLCANPLMAYKKQLKKKEIKKSKKQQVERVEARTLLRDPTKLGEEIEKLEAEAATNRADLELRRKLQALRAHQAVLEICTPMTRLAMSTIKWLIFLNASVTSCTNSGEPISGYT